MNISKNSDVNELVKRLKKYCKDAPTLNELSPDDDWLMEDEWDEIYEVTSKQVQSITKLSLVFKNKR